VLVTLNHKTNLPKVLVSLKKVLEGFSLWAKDQFTLVCQQPELTYNYKKEIIGLTKTYIEGCKLRIRGIRRVWKKDMEGSTKSKDVVKRNNLKLQKLTESAIDKIITAFNNAEREFSKN
jgi:ribosome recycling factor